MLKQYTLVYAPSEKGTMPMVLKDRPDHLKGFLNMPGGKIEEGEDIAQSARRELLEETGLSGSCPFVVGRIRGNNSEIHVVKIGVCESPLRPQEGETEVFAWYKRAELYRNPQLMPNLRLVIPLCESGATGWTVDDFTGNWLGPYHTVALRLDKCDAYRLDVRVHGAAYFKE